MSARSSSWKKRRAVKVALVTILVACLLTGAVLLQYSSDGMRNSKAAWSRSGPFDSLRSFLDLFGGVRQTVAAYMWTKTDEVFHGYLHGDPAQERPLYPYFWLITRLDPHFPMAYYFASWELCRFGRVDEGLRLAKEGVRFNPDSSQLQSNLASIYLFFKKDPLKARYHYLRAIDLTNDKADKAILANSVRICNQVLAGKTKLPNTSAEAAKRAKQFDEEQDKKAGNKG